MPKFTVKMTGKSGAVFKGNDGYTPIKGKDYFTAAEQAAFLKAVTPVKGRDYFEGKEGAMGPKGPKPLAGVDYPIPTDGKDGKPGRDGAAGRDGSPDTPLEIARKLNSVENVLDIKVIKDSEKLFQPINDRLTKIENKPEKGPVDQRWHGGGLSVISHDTTLTGSGTPSSPLSVVAAGTGTVTSVSITPANGVSGTVATPTTTPAISLSLGAITPSSVAASGTIGGSNFSGTSSGSNTGDQTSVSGNAGTATALQNARLIGGTSFNGTADITPGLATTVTTNANLTGPITSSGNATSIASQTGTGSTFAMSASPTFTGVVTAPQAILTANAITASGNAATVPVTSGRNIVTNNSAATLTITMTTTSAVNMQTCIVQILDATGVAQTVTWVNTENSTVSAPTTSNGSTTLPLTVGFIYNSATSKWRCVANA